MRKLTSQFLLIITLFSSASLTAEQIALVGGRLIDGYGHRPIANSVILVEDDMIKQVGTIETLAVPEGYRIISTEGMDVLPGLWESHAHLKITGHADYVHWDKAYAKLAFPPLVKTVVPIHMKTMHKSQQSTMKRLEQVILH